MDKKDVLWIVVSIWLAPHFSEAFAWGFAIAAVAASVLLSDAALNAYIRIAHHMKRGG